MKNRAYTTCLVLYAMYAAAMLMQFAPQSMGLATILMLCAIIAAYVQRRHITQSPYDSHIQWLVRTFWIGGAVYMPAVTLLAAVYLYLNIGDFIAPVDPGLPQPPDTVLAQMGPLEVYADTARFYILSAACLTPVALWWLWRCAAGYRYLKRGAAVPKVMRWL